MNKELLKGLTEEQIALLKKCKSTEEILAAAKEQGVELTQEQLEAVSGGECQQDIDMDMTCPVCGAWEGVVPDGDHYRCNHCKMDFGHRNVNY